MSRLESNSPAVDPHNAGDPSPPSQPILLESDDQVTGEDESDEVLSIPDEKEENSTAEEIVSAKSSPGQESPTKQWSFFRGTSTLNICSASPNYTDDDCSLPLGPAEYRRVK
jgi:hypothetical protein